MSFCYKIVIKLFLENEFSVIIDNWITFSADTNSK